MVQVIEGERKVLVFVEVEKVEVERRGRNGNNKNVGILGKGNKGGLDDPTLLFSDASRQSFGFCRIVRKKPKVVVRYGFVVVSLWLVVWLVLFEGNWGVCLFGFFAWFVLFVCVWVDWFCSVVRTS